MNKQHHFSIEELTADHPDWQEFVTLIKEANQEGWAFNPDDQPPQPGNPESRLRRRAAPADHRGVALPVLIRTRGGDEPLRTLAARQSA